MAARDISGLHAWAGGVYDAGGSIYLHRMGQHVVVQLTVTANHKRTLETLAELFEIPTACIRKKTLRVPGAKQGVMLAVLAKHSIRYKELLMAASLKEKLWARGDTGRKSAIYLVWKESTKRRKP